MMSNSYHEQVVALVQDRINKSTPSAEHIKLINDLVDESLETHRKLLLPSHVKQIVDRQIELKIQKMTKDISKVALNELRNQLRAIAMDAANREVKKFMIKFEQ